MESWWEEWRLWTTSWVLVLNHLAALEEPWSVSLIRYFDGFEEADDYLCWWPIGLSGSVVRVGEMECSRSRWFQGVEAVW